MLKLMLFTLAVFAVEQVVLEAFSLL